MALEWAKLSHCKKAGWRFNCEKWNDYFRWLQWDFQDLIIAEDKIKKLTGMFYMQKQMLF